MKGRYSASFVLSVLMHIVLLSFILFSLSHTSMELASKHIVKEKPTIDAIAIDASSLEKEVKRLNDIEHQKKQQELARQKKLEQERLAAIKQRKAEEARLAKAREAQKALEREKQAKLKQEQEALQKIEQAKAAALKAKREAEAKAVEAKKEAERMAKQKEAERQRHLAEEVARQKRLAEEQAHLQRLKEAQAIKARQITESQIDQYSALLQAKVRQNWRQPLDVNLDNLVCKVSVRFSPSGEVVNTAVVQSSGNKAFDRSTELAIMKASPFPMPSDAAALEKFTKENFTFEFNPEAT